jgi:ribosomal protein S18 acetylase RimI-like enzyme
MIIRLLDENDAQEFVRFRRASLIEAPLALTASPEDDFVSAADDVRKLLRGAPDWVIVGAFAGSLAGTAGLYRSRHRKVSHKSYLWGMYVAPAFRRQHLGRSLVEAAIAHARTLVGVEWIELSVSSAAPAAQRLYESLGFEHWGTEPDALRHEGRSVVERHMALKL